MIWWCPVTRRPARSPEPARSEPGHGRRGQVPGGAVNSLGVQADRWGVDDVAGVRRHVLAAEAAARATAEFTSQGHGSMSAPTTTLPRSRSNRSAAGGTRRRHTRLSHATRLLITVDAGG